MRQRPNALMLFAAGMGTRMGVLTASRPKPLIKVGGRALIDHALAQADAVDVSRIVVNLHYLGGQIRAHLAGRSAIVFSDEKACLLDTGGGLRHALPGLGPGPVFTLNTDAVWTGANALRQLSRAWVPDRMDGLLLLVPTDHATGHTGSGDFAMAPDGQLMRGTDHVYTGAQIIRTDLLAAISGSAFSLNQLWDLMLRRGTLCGIAHNGGWCDVGRPESIALAEALLRKAEDV